MAHKIYPIMPGRRRPDVRLTVLHIILVLALALFISGMIYYVFMTAMGYDPW